MPLARSRHHAERLYLAVLLVVPLTASESLGSGCHDLPSGPAQFFGYGYGPGYHAPIVKAPCHRPPHTTRYVSVPCYPAAPYGPPCAGVTGCLTPTGACPRCQPVTPYPAAPTPTLAPPRSAGQPDRSVHEQRASTPAQESPVEPLPAIPAESPPTDPAAAADEPTTASPLATLELGPAIANGGLSPESTALTMGDLFGPPRLTSAVDLQGLDAYQSWVQQADD